MKGTNETVGKKIDFLQRMSAKSCYTILKDISNEKYKKMCVLKNSYIHPKHSRNSLMQSREKKLRCETKKNKPILSENKNIS